MDVAVNRAARRARLAVLVGALAVLGGCSEAPRLIVVRAASVPITGASLVPQATPLAGGRLLLSWQRPLESGGYAFEMAIRRGNEWSAVRSIAGGANLSMFSADLPAVAALPEGKLLAYWELKDTRDGDPYATEIQTAISTDEGRTWGTPLKPYGEAYAGQHSFLSWFPSRDGIGLLWLDADERSRIRHRHAAAASQNGSDNMGSIGLRYAALDNQGQIAHEAFVDPITCECCPTSAAVTARGPVVVYRSRLEPPGTKPSEVRADRPTVRDISITRLEQGRWTRPHTVHADNWVINACPDNGPSVDAAGNDLAVAWWTRANDVPKVQVAFSTDAGETFGEPIRVDSGKGEGQVTLAVLPGGKAAVVGWQEEGRTWARYVGSTGVMSKPAELGPSPHHNRLPRWITDGSRSATAVWTRKQNDLPYVGISLLSW